MEEGGDEEAKEGETEKNEETTEEKEVINKKETTVFSLRKYRFDKV